MEDTKKGRPKKAAGTTKPVVQSIRYTQEEWDDLEKKLNESGLSYSKYMRQAAKRSKVVKFDLADYTAIRDTKQELIKIGINISTIARHAAMVTDQDSFNIFLEDLRNCREIAKELYAKLDEINKAMLV